MPESPMSSLTQSIPLTRPTLRQKPLSTTPIVVRVRSDSAPESKLGHPLAALLGGPRRRSMHATPSDFCSRLFRNR